MPAPTVACIPLHYAAPAATSPWYKQPTNAQQKMPYTMNTQTPPAPFPQWDTEHAATLDAAQLLLYRSNLLGSDLRITNYGGGNTSAKLMQTDPLSGAPVQVLWVKGSGGDLGSMRIDGFATLYMDKLRALHALYRGPEHEDEMVAYLPHCTFNLNPRAASIDTPLHAYLPFAHVDHMHPDSVIAIAAMADSQRLTQQIFHGSLGWLPWRRPGFELGLMLQRHQASYPGQCGLVLAGHGLFTWGADARACYENTVAVIAQAQQWLARERALRKAVSFGGPARQPLAGAQQDAVLTRLLPVLRGLACGADAAPPGADGVPPAGTGKLLHLERQSVVQEFVNSHELAPLAALGTSCPDHFLRTKIRPLVLDESVYALQGAALRQALEHSLAGYRAQYAAYYQRCKRANSPAQRDANPVIILLPGIGMVAMAADKATARVAAEFYLNAINVMREANALDRYTGLPEQEAFDIEYWLLEEAKLQRLPPPRPLAGKIALITGGAGGIGQAIARRLLAEGACVLLADINQGALDAATAALTQTHGRDAVRAVPCDVTSEASVSAAFSRAVLEYGGLDILVNNAGMAAAAALEDTSLELWSRTQALLATGYFLAGREAFRLMKAQGRGGAIISIASKNAMVASPQASAYCAAKAAEVQLSRSFALEGAPFAIRANVVNPDAVIRGSGIWSGAWSRERAAANHIAEQDLEAFYRDRSMLKRSVFPEDIAQAVYFFAAEQLSAKCTGNILNVDAGNLASFTR